ncbi:MAG TPA: FecR family protein, partial [Polyangiaceae bacterium]
MIDDARPELEGELERARAAQPSWTLSRQQQLIWGVRGRLQARRRRTSTLLVAAGLALAAGMGVAGFKMYGGSASGENVESIRAERWNLRDGSEIVIESPTTVIKKKRESATEILFELEAGAAHFEVVSKPNRVFRVNAGRATVEVVGTSFRVARKQSSSEVSVDRGRVIVSWSGGSRVLNKGEAGTFPPGRNPPRRHAGMPALRRAGGVRHAGPGAGGRRRSALGHLHPLHAEAAAGAALRAGRWRAALRPDARQRGPAVRQ